MARMQLSASTLIVLSLGLASALPQNLSNLELPPGLENIPTCAYPGLITLFTQSGCSSTSDTACLCAQPELFSTLGGSIQTACPSAADQETVNNYAASFCGGSSPASSSSEATAATSSAPTSDAASAAATTFTAAATTTTSVISPTGGANSTNSSTPSYASPTPSTSIEPSLGSGMALRDHFAFGSMGALVIALGGMTWIFAEL